ncbi:MAG: c-type cytochrome, partial [Myxococcota bacterium]
MDSLKSWVTIAAVSLAASGCGYASANTGSDEPTAEMAASGEVHYTNYCAPCHGDLGAGNPDVAAPSVAGLPYWYVERQLYNFRNGLRGVSYDDIAGKRMRPMAWAIPSDQQV